MQTDYKHLYKLAAEKHGTPEQLYKDLGNFVFSQLYKEMRRPQKLILKLRGVGKWILRRKRMKYIIENFPLDHDHYEQNSEHLSSYTLFKYENKKEIHELFEQRLQDYDHYIQQREETRKIRYATQVPIQPSEGKEERHKSS